MFDHAALARLCARAMASGAVRKSLMRFEWDISDDCEMPLTRDLYARPSAPPGQRDVTIARGTAHPLLLVLTVRCRKCARCLAVRRAQWAARARTELKSAPRTWLGTLTLRPEEHYRLTCMASQRWPDFEEMAEQERFRRRCCVTGPLVTKYLKRVRKQSGVPLRYLLVAEKHRSGLPHYHILIHEQDPIYPVRYRLLTEQWWHGFSKFNLVDHAAAGTYVCKYLAKSAESRVRASIGYGRDRDDEPVPALLIVNEVNVRIDPTTRTSVKSED